MESWKSLCFIATVEYSVDAFLYNHIKELSKFYKITVITNNKNKNFITGKLKGITVIDIKFSRKINLFNDVICLFHLFTIFCTKKFDVVTTITPKAGLLGIFAAFFAFIPIRIHCFTGQIWATKFGWKRSFFKFIDKFINYMTTRNIVDGKSQYNFLLRENIISKKTSIVFANGSICGVDLARFKPNKDTRLLLRKSYGIPNSAFVFLFVGRLNSEKGINDLLSAFKKANLKSAFLILVGPDEENIFLKVKNVKNIIIHEFSSSPEDFMASSNLLCLPSYREGFGNVVIEAAAAGTPSMISDIYGLCDSVIPNKTGLIHKVRDIDEMVKLLRMAHNNKLLIKKLGDNARLRVTKAFNSKLLTEHWVNFYKKETSKLLKS
jgi:glycosyltransferase involved in cell wall biosynthesis